MDERKGQRVRVKPTAQEADHASQSGQVASEGPQVGRSVNPARSLPVIKLRPAYLQVSEQLRELVLSGWLKAGERLPSEPELAAQFGTSRSTVREAIRILAADGLLTTVRGVNGGSFATPPTPARVGD